ncbi:hypothetical protein ENSA5_57190 [Enhygromyxa salina]|uniref:Uncharacterized protein n=1 Tax=Enhygromyxa salina TaxID=215803 RepID=A0A2S9XEF1_9BACT|nr:hypothetical protein ENSA5_57190 [Enhygromyxa salina]
MGIAYVADVGVVALLLLTGCPGDDIGGNPETGETGDPGPDPVDPLDGDGARPPGSPDLEQRWVAPSTLGNGLVHDTRADVDPGVYAAPLTSGELEIIDDDPLHLG